jgi:hypothetical protein
MTPSLQRFLSAMHLALMLTVISFLWNVATVWLGVREAPITYFALLALVSGGTAALVGNGFGACMAFVASGALAPLSWWAALLPAALVVLYRVAWRAIVLARRDKSVPLGPPLGFWRTLQAWAGWSLAELD